MKEHLNLLIVIYPNGNDLITVVKIYFHCKYIDCNDTPVLVVVHSENHQAVPSQKRMQISNIIC